MKAVLQRVTYAKVSIENQIFSEINQGLLVLIGFSQTDTKESISPILEKILQYRVFADQADKMNLNVMDIKGEILLVPQFTLVSNTKKGLRPSFSNAAPPETGKFLFDYSVKHAKNLYKQIKIGSFGANMAVEFCNDGPVTFILES